MAVAALSVVRLVPSHSRRVAMSVQPDEQLDVRVRRARRPCEESVPALRLDLGTHGRVGCSEADDVCVSKLWLHALKLGVGVGHPNDIVIQFGLQPELHPP